jgi:hypothetical protein
VNINKWCFCALYAVRVKVSGAEVKHTEFMNSPSNPSNFANRLYYPRDVDSVFKIVEDAYESKAYKIEVIFDDAYGYPAKATIDRNRDIVDDESVFELANFEAVHVD